MRPPNILYLHCHDAGRAPDFAGGTVPCPNLSALAGKGVNFTKTFCVAPTCSPSRAALLTGKYPLENGMMGLAHLGFRLRNHGEHLVNRLRPAGYQSILCGFQHVSNPPAGDVKEIGYDRILTEDGSLEVATHHAVDFLKNHRADDPPFFLDAGFFPPHRPFPQFDLEVPECALGTFPQLAMTEEHRRDIHAFAASLMSFDRCCGAILDALGEAGLEKDTLVIATTDHGPPFPGMKGMLSDGGLGVFMVLHLPGRFDGGRRDSEMRSHLDIVPTILELVGMEPPGDLHGTPLHGEPDREHLFFETNFHAAMEPARGVRTNRWKYIQNHNLPRGRILPNIDDSPSKRLLHEIGELGWVLPHCELYDILADPLETRNLAVNPEHSDVRDQLAAVLKGWMVERNDPLMKGDLIPPPGSILTPWTSYSPGENARATDGISHEA